MCQNEPSVAICACGAHFAGCDFVEFLTHITQQSSPAHKWVYLETNEFKAGRQIADNQPRDYKEYLALKRKLWPKGKR